MNEVPYLCLLGRCYRNFLNVKRRHICDLCHLSIPRLVFGGTTLLRLEVARLLGMRPGWMGGQLEIALRRATVAAHQVSEIAMAGVAKKTIAEEIAETRRAIEDALHSSYMIDELSVERAKRKAAKFLETPNTPVNFRIVLHHEVAYLLGLQGKYSESMEHVAASTYWGLEPVASAFSTAHLSLLNGQMLRAREAVDASDFLQNVPPHSRSLLAAIQMNLGAMEKAAIATGHEKSEFKHVRAAVQILKSIGEPDIELTKRLDTACRVIRENVSHPILGFKLFAMEGEGILYRFLVRASIDDVIELNDKVLDALMDNHDGPLDRELTICTTPWTADEKPDREEAYYVGLA